jgi:hypothetical protein
MCLLVDSVNAIVQKYLGIAMAEVTEETVKRNTNVTMTYG